MAEDLKRLPPAGAVPVARFERAATDLGAGQLVRGVRDFVDAHVAGDLARRRIERGLERLVALAAAHVERADEARLVAVVDVMSQDVQLVLWAVPAGHPDRVGREQPTGGFEAWTSFPRA